MTTRARSWSFLATAMLAAAVAVTPIRQAAAATPAYGATAEVLQLPGSPAYLCLGAVATSSPPSGCSGVPLTGVDASRLPGAHRYGNGTVETARVSVVGTWDGRALTPTRPIVRGSDSPTGPPAPELPGTACAHPGGHRPTGTGDPLQRLYLAAKAQPDWSYFYASAGATVANVAFTGDLARHEAALRRIYAGPLCVVRGARSARSLAALQHRIVADERLLAAHGIVVFGVGALTDRMLLTVAVADRAGRSYLAARYGPLGVTPLLSAR